MKAIGQRRCFNHPAREAAARCPECGRSFCRECVTEHHDRVVCSNCLRKIAGVSRGAARRRGFFAGLFRFGVGVILAWIFFLSVGRFLLSFPTEAHEAAFWQEPFLRGAGLTP